EAGARPDAETVQGHGLGPEPDLQESLRARVRDVRWRAARLHHRRLLLRPFGAGHRAPGADGADQRRRPLPVHRGGVAGAHANGELAGAVEPAGPDEDLRDAGIRTVALAARG